MTHETFSRRHGYKPEDREISIRDDAPKEVREAILIIAEGELDLSPSLIRGVLCTVLRQLPDSSNWSEYPNVWSECQSLMETCPWYKVYDFVEALYRHLSQSFRGDLTENWERLINEYFNEAGVGWRLVGGQLEARGPEAFVSAVDSARIALTAASLPTAQQEIHEALRDLSRRPNPDLTGAIHHAMAALECTAREVCGDPKATLGEILKKHPSALPKPLDESISKMWGYASEIARHVREGRGPMRDEAELVVGVAAAACTFLAAKIRRER